MADHVHGKQLEGTKAQFEQSLLKEGHFNIQQVREIESNMTQSDWDKIHANQVKAAQRTVDTQFGTPTVTGDGGIHKTGDHSYSNTHGQGNIHQRPDGTWTNMDDSGTHKKVDHSQGNIHQRPDGTWTNLDE